MINDEFKKHMLTNGHALFGIEAKKKADIIAFKEITPDTLALQQLEQALNADFLILLKNKNLIAELQNIQRTKDFILHQIKHKPDMPVAELQAYIHELKDIKAMLEAKKADLAANPDLIAVDNGLLAQLSKLKKLIQVGFHVLLNSNKSTDAEKNQFEELNNEINTVLNLPKVLTNQELQSRIKTLAAAKVFLDKWLPTIAHRQAVACDDDITPLPQKGTFFSEHKQVELEKMVMRLRSP